MGVDLFFMLSGFILSLNYLDGFRTISPRSYWKFLRARLARIYPVHLFTLLLLTAFVLSARGAGAKLNSAHYTGFTWVTNVFLVHIWPGFNRGLSWNFPSWSISPNGSPICCFPCLLSGLAPRSDLTYGLCWLFRLRGAVFLWNRTQPHPLGLAPRYCGIRWRMLFVPDLPAWLEMPTSAVEFRRSGAGDLCGVHLFRRTRACSLPFFALLIWGLAVNTEGWLAGPFAVYWGQVSYSLYMTHGLCQIFLNRALPVGHFVTSSIVIRAGLVALYLFLIVVAAVLTYHYVETPARHWLNRSEKVTVPVKEVSVPPPLEEEQSAEA